MFQVLYKSISQTASELVWINDILEDLNASTPQPITVYCDNKAAHFSKSYCIYHVRKKHLKLDCHYVREHIEEGFINTTYIKSSFQLAYI